MSSSEKLHHDLVSTRHRAVHALGQRQYTDAAHLMLTLTLSPLVPLSPRSALEEFFIYSGCAIGYWQGDIAKLVSGGQPAPASLCGCPHTLWLRLLE